MKSHLWIVSLLVFVLSSCVNSMEEVSQTSGLADPGIEKGKDVEMYYSENGQVKLRIKGKTLTRYVTEEPYVEFDDGLVVDFFDDSLRVISKLTARYGVRYENEGKTIVRNNVVVLNENGEELSTEELIWDESRHIIYTDKQVKITTDEEVLYGRGLEADETMTEYTILQPEGVIKINMDDAETDEDI
jgi:LPS export ABC transporter protein LptC